MRYGNGIEVLVMPRRPKGDPAGDNVVVRALHRVQQGRAVAIVKPAGDNAAGAPGSFKPVPVVRHIALGHSRHVDIAVTAVVLNDELTRVPGQDQG